MADNNLQEPYYSDQFAILKSMFGDAVTEDVICTVIESCDGNVHLAADAIMNITIESNEGNGDNKTNIVQVSNESIVTNPNKTLKPVGSTATTNATSTNEASIKVVPISTTSAANTSGTLSNSQQIDKLSATFAEAFRNTGAVPQKSPTQASAKPRMSAPFNNVVWSEELKKIFQYHNQGIRTMILLRGASGSGKSHLARYIIDSTIGPSEKNYDYHIFSSDSYFMRGGVYQYDRNLLDIAHMTNQKKVFHASNKGVSPIIVDNTNIALWEMQPYVRDGVRNGYVLFVLEPNTPWAKNAYLLTQKNTHKVPHETIRRMLDNYEKCTPESLIQSWRLSYPPNMKPPVKRDFPPINASSQQTPKAQTKISLKQDIPLTVLPKFLKSAGTKQCSPPLTTSTEANNVLQNSASVSSATNAAINIVDTKSPKSDNETIVDLSSEIKVKNPSESHPKEEADSEDEIKLQKINSVQKKLEMFEKLEKEWEDGESWDTATNIIKASQDQAVEPKPPRDAENSNSNNLIKPGDVCDDWSKITLFLPSWQDTAASAPISETQIPVETKDVGTAIETGDLHNDANKTLYTNPRNINEMNNNKCMPLKLPTKIIVDKSTSTHEYDFHADCVSECKNSKHHFTAFRKLFNMVPRHILKDVFDTCRGDVNWAVNIILDSYPDIQINVPKIEDSAESDEEPTEECHCLAAYNIIPHVNTSVPTSPALPETSAQNSPASQKKPKRETKMSENLLQLKRQIERNVTISDNHYSQHYLDTRRRREGLHGDRGISPATNNDQNTKIDINESDNPKSEDNASTPLPSTSGYNYHVDPSDSESETSETKDNDTLVSINIGHEFQIKLDELFGMEGFPYPEYVKPIVNMPMSLLREINAYWQESLAHQMDEMAKHSKAMIKQDEEFARKLIAKEEEMCRQGQKPDMPSLKEIMDMEMAYSIYEKNISEWRNNEPQDLASRLSRDKLYNLFPDISHDILSELLMAHEYNFKETVESLLISTGQPELLEDDNAVEKFVMHKEMERKEKYVQEQTKTLDESEWPSTSEPERPVTLETVEYYRSEAEKSLNYRNLNFNKAKVYFERNIPSAATFFSDIATLHTKKYEHNSALAAAYLMSYHMNKNPNRDVVDLHYLRVKEALVTMDLFIDEIIVHLRERNLPAKSIYIITGRGTHSNNGPRIKPAAKKRLKHRSIGYREINPGLLSGKISFGHKMTNELPT